MDAEALIVTFLLVGVTLPLVLALSRSSAGTVRATALGVWALGAGLAAWAAVAYEPASRTPPVDRPIEVDSDGYVSSKACRSCHPDQYGSWYASYHRTMTQKATTETVLGPNDDVLIEARGVTYALENRGDEVWIEYPDPTWDREGVEAPRIWAPIVQVTGSHEAQIYWTTAGQDRALSLLPIAYRMLDEQCWVPLDVMFVTPPSNVQEVGTGRWNRVCLRCHATHSKPGLADPGQPDEYDTAVGELGIACEACHGPGAEHIALNQDPRRRYELHDAGEGDPSMVDPADLSRELSAHVCGQCHGVFGFYDEEDRVAWRTDGYRFRPGDDLDETRQQLLENETMFWSDGMMRVSGREFAGLSRSPCFERGEMTCLSCHEMHQKADDPRPVSEWANDLLKPDMETDHACLQCHEDYAGAERIAAHTHHAPGTLGSACMDCHMPHTTYGLLKGMRSHQVSSPSAQETVETGRPNACNQCHLDRTLHWTARQLEEWYEIPRPELTRDQQVVAMGPLQALTGDAGIRALLAWNMGWGPAREASGTEWMAPYLIALLRDPYYSVRYIARRTFEQHPEFAEISYDYLASPEQILTDTSPAYHAWVRRGGPTGRDRADELLIGPGGALNMREFERLSELRDNRPVTLNE